MTPHILIIGAGLTGLTTALRLATSGLNVSLVDERQIFPSASSELTIYSKLDSQSLSQTENYSQSSNSLPMVLHGFQYATWSLVQELKTISLLTSYPPARIEFVTSQEKSVQFNPILAPAPIHSLIGLLFFKGLRFSDRWSLLKKLEELWEGGSETPKDLDSQSVTTWLTTLGQSPKAQQDIWHPLCQFFLGMDSRHSSAQYFKETLVQCFMTARQNSRIFIPPLDEETLLLTPLRNFLASQNVTLHPECTATHFQCDSEGISGVKLSDGRTLTADYYISTLPRRALVACLPERLLAKFAYFSNLCKLEETPTLVVHLEVPCSIPNPRLLLSANTFDWLALRPRSGSSSRTTIVSCVATGKQQLLEKSEHHIFSELSSHLPPPLNENINTSHPTRLIRNPHALLACTPDISAFRPLQKSPIANFFVAGPWTDTSLPPSRESSIVSANLCAQAVNNSFSTL